MSPQSRFFTSERLNLHYLVWGDESKPPILLVHGTHDHARSWDQTAEALTDRYCVYAPDLRGHGDSQWSLGGNYSIIDYALDMHAFGEAVGRAPYDMIAHSLGGSIALEYMGAFPEKVRRLVNIEGLGGAAWAASLTPRPAHVRMRKWIERMRDLEQRKAHVYPTIDEAAERMLEANKHLTKEMAHHLTVHGSRQVEGGYAWKYDNFTRAGSPYDFNGEDARDLWNQIRSPILFIWGETSFGRRFAENPLDLSAFHNYRLEQIADAGHWVQHDQFETFIRLTNEFLSG